jgi:hypothetical protein
VDDSFSSRFKKLEKARDAQKAAPTPLASPGRFGKDAPPAPAEDLPKPAEALSRFRPATPLPPGEEMPVADAEPEGTQPFQRCAVCETDSTRFAQSCANCGARLDTPEQRAFNERVWAQHREENARTDAELAKIQRDTAGDETLARSQRQLGEMLARQVGERERARLSWMGDDPDPGVEGAGRRETPGLRLLRLIPSTRARLLVAIGLGLIGLVFAYVFFTGSIGARAAAAVFFYLIITLFVPGGRRRRRRWPFR